MSEHSTRFTNILHQPRKGKATLSTTFFRLTACMLAMSISNHMAMQSAMMLLLTVLPVGSSLLPLLLQLHLHTSQPTSLALLILPQHNKERRERATSPKSHRTGIMFPVRKCHVHTHKWVQLPTHKPRGQERRERVSLWRPWMSSEGSPHKLCGSTKL